MALFPSIRLLMLLLTCMMVAVLQAIYSSIHIAWVCMVNDSYAHTNRSIDPDYHGDLPWDKAVQQYVFSAFLFGALASVTLPGYMVDRFGAKKTGLGCLALASTVTILIPPLAERGFGYVAAARAITGLGVVVTWPLVYGTCSHWTPSSETGVALILASTGFPLGNFAILLFGGLECSALRWEWVFYITGITGYAAGAAWLLLYADDPRGKSLGNRMLTDPERDYIMKGRTRKEKNRKRSVPWRALLTSLPVISCLVLNLTNWSVSFFLSAYTPTFYKEVLHIGLATNGALSSLPSLVFMCSRWIVGPVSDAIKFQSMKLSVFSVKVFNSVACFGTAVCLVGISFVNEETSSGVAVGILCLQMFFIAFAAGGYQKSVLFIAPDYSGTIGSLMNSLGAIGPIAEPYILAALTPNGTAAEWASVFWINAALAVFGGVFFCVFADGSIQKWAETPLEKPFLLFTVVGNSKTKRIKSHHKIETK